MQSFNLWQLVFYFLKLGTTGFGGPIALVGYMQRDLVEEKKWFSKENYLNGLALSQLFPGPLAAQLAIYLGFLKGKITGATLVGIAFILPSFLIVLGLSYFYVHYQSFSFIHSVFYGMSAAVIGVILRAAYKLTKLTLDKRKGFWLIFIALMLTTAWIGKASFLLFLISGLLAVIFYAFPKNPKFFSVVPLELFFFFFKSSLVVFGSGMAIIPFIYGDVVQNFHWLSDQQFLDAVSVGMITPGPVLITVAFIGFLADGLKGSFAAAIGIFTPVYLFVILFSPWFHKIVKNLYVKTFVEGVTAAAAGAIAGSVYILGKKAIVDWPTLMLAVVVLVLTTKTKIPDPVLILGGGLLGIGLKMI